jgi:hypothetical protein
VTIIADLRRESGLDTPAALPYIVGKQRKQ